MTPEPRSKLGVMVAVVVGGLVTGALCAWFWIAVAATAARILRAWIGGEG